MGSVNNNNNPLIQYTATNQKAATTDAQEQIRVTRELDGLKDTGVLGELLANGSENLSDVNKYFSTGKFSVSGLLAENNQAVSSKADIYKDENDPNCTTTVQCADDLYLAGDPHIGGKRNDYASEAATVSPGYYTMFQDGADGGPKITVNGHADTINKDGNTALTEYGFVVQDASGKKTNATLSGGVLTIIDANGQSRKLLPGETYYVGDPNDPTAKFYYGTAKGAGANGTDETRLMVDYYEKPSADAVKQLVAQGVSKDKAESLRSTTTLSYGFRTPDGVDTYGSSEGVGSGTALKTLSNGVKTYYDTNINEGSCQLVDIASCPKPPEEPPTAPDEHARIWGDPHIEDADGGKYDFQEAGLFNVLKDKGVNVNAKTVKGANNTTLITQAGMTVGNRTLLVTQPDNTFEVGYSDPSVKTAPIKLADGQTVMLDNGGSIKRTGNKVMVDTGNGEYKVQYDTTGVYQGTKYINIDVWSKAGGVLADGQAPTGLIGETFDKDTTKQTKPKQNTADYKVSTLLNKTTPTTTTTTTTPTTPTTGTNTGTTAAEDTTDTDDDDTTTTTTTGTTNTTGTGTTTTNTGTTNTGTTPTTTTPATTPTPDATGINALIQQLIQMLLKLFGGQT